MHIVFVAHAYPRWSGDVAGAFIERLAGALLARGHQMTVLAPSDRGKGGEEERGGIAIRWVRYAAPEDEILAYRGTMVEAVGSFRGKRTAFRLVAALRRELIEARRSAPDVVHAHWWVPAGVAAWSAGGRRGCRYVVTLHGTDVRLLENSRTARFLAGRVLRRSAAVTAVSSYLVDRVAAAVGVDAASVMVQPMPADLARFARTSRGGGGIVTVGRLVAQKRIDVMLEAVARLHRDGRAVPVTIIGDGPLRDALMDHAARLGIASSTRFLGEVEPGQLTDAIGDADVFAFTATSEGLGLAAAEALLMGIPVVATEVGGGVHDIVPRDGPGRIVPDGDPQAFAEALATLLDDPRAREQAAATGELMRARLDPDAAAQRFEELYFRVSGRAGGWRA